MTSRIIFALAALVLVGMTGWLGWRSLHPAEKACRRSVALCQPPEAEKAMHDCRELLADVSHRLGGTVERITGRCMVDAESCNESLACLAHADRVANEMKKR
jgi:hypothetical protein